MLLKNQVCNAYMCGLLHKPCYRCSTLMEQINKSINQSNTGTCRNVPLSFMHLKLGISTSTSLMHHMNAVNKNNVLTMSLD